MFYSHQLLARKAPLGQIWMAATMHAKLNRRKLDKLNLIHICEEILNPSNPMALRLSGILMGGVVIVYERKVELLYDDVTRLLVEINEAWKVKAARDPRDRTLLPKSKTQAKKEAVTLPEAREEDVGGIEQSLSLNDLYNANATVGFGFHQSAYFAMQLDDVDGSYFNIDHQEEIVGEHSHQAHPENITLDECFDSCQVNTDAYNHFERFDIEGDEGTQPSFTYGEYVEIPTTVVTSPPPEEVQRAEEIPDHHGCKEARQDEQRQGPVKRKPRKQAGMAMDYEQTVIPGNIYQSWLQDANDIVSRRGTKKKVCRDIISTMKVANLMELPPIIFIGDSSSYGNQSIYYPKALMELWMKSTQPAHDSPSARTSPPLPPEPSISSPEGYQYQGAMGFNFEDFHGGGEPSESQGVSIENPMTTVADDEIPEHILMLRANLRNSGANLITGATFSTPANDVGEVRTIPRSESGHCSPPLHAEVNPGRSNKKRPYSSSRHSGSSLEPVAEEPTWPLEPNFKMSRLSENGPTPDHGILVETGPTQTQQPIICEPDEKITDSIRMLMKSHFETPGAPQVESLDALAAGMNRKGAALFFYQTCVLATSDFLRVKQDLPYGEILISKGGKM